MSNRRTKKGHLAEPPSIHVALRGEQSCQVGMTSAIMAAKSINYNVSLGDHLYFSRMSPNSHLLKLFIPPVS